MAKKQYIQAKKDIEALLHEKCDKCFSSEGFIPKRKTIRLTKSKGRKTSKKI
jgi:hypothetical protein|tara:strand:- start:223 stop:378 length:156 start_codon:yes stop_codon:yes gene_type:complete